MAIEVLADVMNARKGPWRYSDLLVLITLAGYAHPDGTNIFPSVERLALACRLKVRNTQICLKALQTTCIAEGCPHDGQADAKCCGDEQLRLGLGHGVLIKVKTQAAGRFNEYRIHTQRLQRLLGCKVCGGVVCDDEGCKKEQRGVQIPVAHIEIRPRNVRDTSARDGAAVEGDPVARGLWAKVKAGFGEEKFRLHLGLCVPKMDGATLVVLCATEKCAIKAQDVVTQTCAFAGCEVVVRWVGGKKR